MSNHESLEQERERFLATATPEGWEEWLERAMSGEDKHICLMCIAFTGNCRKCTGNFLACLYLDHDRTKPYLSKEQRVSNARLRLERLGILPVIKRPKVGDIVKVGDLFPAGTEFVQAMGSYPYFDTRLRLDWENRRASLWIGGGFNRYWGSNEWSEAPNPEAIDIGDIIIKPHILKIAFIPDKAIIGESQPMKKMGLTLITRMIEAHSWFEKGSGCVTDTVMLPTREIKSHIPGVEWVYLLSKNYSDCQDRKGKTFFGIALYEDGHAEMRYFEGGKCPWLVYTEADKWPEDYEQYGAFTWKGYLYCREELSHYMGSYSIIRDAPEGYRAVPFLRNTSDAVQNLSNFPSYITKKEF